MPHYRFPLLCLVMISGCARSQEQLTIKPSSNRKFMIGTTWNGYLVPQNETVSVILSARSEAREVRVKIDAPFYDDPAPQQDPQKPFWGLWNYEVVQLFFLNEEDQYLELEIGPHGQQIVLLMDGQRNTIRHSLPLNVTTTIETSSWRAMADIPLDYFPRQVTKFNAYALNGVGIDRKYLALYPSNNHATEPDLHNLKTFQPIEFVRLSGAAKEDDFHSELWQNALQGIFSYTIHRQWNNFRTRILPTEVTLQGFEGGVEINFTIPNNKEPYPSEALVIAFENKKGEAVRLRMHVDGSYFVDFLIERKMRINAEAFPLDFRVDSSNADYVKGSALVLPSYFPPHVKLMNIYALFGMESMIALTFKPINVVEDVAFIPDLNSIKHFTPIDFDLLVESNVEYSSVWKQMLHLPQIIEENGLELETSTSSVEIKTALHDIIATTSSTLFGVEMNLEEKFEPNTRQPLVETETHSDILMHEKDIGSLFVDLIGIKKEEKYSMRDIFYEVTEEVTDETTQTTPIIDIPRTSYSMGTTQSPETRVPTKIPSGQHALTIPEIVSNTDAAPIMELPPSTERSFYINTSQTQKDHLEPQPKSPLRFFLRTRPKEPKRQQFPRRYEEPKSNHNELPITFQLAPRPRGEAANVQSSSQDIDSEIPMKKEENLLDYPQEEDNPLEGGERPVVMPPHLFCFTEGLVQDSFRCQIFYECIVEEGDWIVYRWRCKRGFFYDPETVACVRGFC